MKSLKSLFDSFPVLVINRYFHKAKVIKQNLDNGIDYQAVGGKKLRLAENLIRFKLGEYRLIFKRSESGFVPDSLIQRKNLHLFLKRR